VVGGGDSALETAIALARSGGRVTLCHRRAELSRPKAENVETLESLRAGVTDAGSLRLALSTEVKEIRETEVILSASGNLETIPNDVVFMMIGREAPLDFFRRSGVSIRSEWRGRTWAGFLSFLLFCVFLYNWKAGGALYHAFEARQWFPFNIPSLLAGVSTSFSDPSTLAGTLGISLGSPGFYYSLAYCLCVVIFGIQRIRRRRTPYITAQTLTLMAVQVVPLFLLPYILLPWLGHNGWFDSGTGRWLGDQLFPMTEWDPQGREYWRAFGLILAWPLFIWNVFTAQPMWLWLGISFAQTFVLIPILIYFWGKGAYCGWICSCGALSETLGDAHRQKMPHGPFWNRLNMLGQAVLAVALILLGTRIAGWVWPDSWAGSFHAALLNEFSVTTGPLRIQVNYYWWVDVMLAGIVGVGCYFWLSGRVWCRFACPLAALMHVYTQFSRFRILSEKKKCISCNVCTTVCHQGIDVMSFANKGAPMADPECVRCSACVQSCPTGTLSFGQVDPRNLLVIRKDRIEASPVLMAEAGGRQDYPGRGASD
jgi:Fe-S-cluster-containing hydrogenase component 2